MAKRIKFLNQDEKAELEKTGSGSVFSISIFVAKNTKEEAEKVKDELFDAIYMANHPGLDVRVFKLYNLKAKEPKEDKRTKGGK